MLISLVGIMKKKVFIITVLIFLFITSMFGAMEPQSGTIMFAGFIEGDIYFIVDSLQTSSADLLSDSLSPTGSGVLIGKWTFRVDNPPVNDYANFYVTYTYASLANKDVDDTIDFILLESEGEDVESDSLVKRSSGDAFKITNEENSITTTARFLSARLTDEGLTTAMKAAAVEYSSNITVTLTSD